MKRKMIEWAVITVAACMIFGTSLATLIGVAIGAGIWEIGERVILNRA